MGIDRKIIINEGTSLDEAIRLIDDKLPFVEGKFTACQQCGTTYDLNTGECVDEELLVKYPQGYSSTVTLDFWHCPDYPNCTPMGVVD